MDVSESAVTIKGFYPGSFPEGFCGCYTEELGGKLYVGFRFSAVFGIFETGDFHVAIPVEGEIDEVILKTGAGETSIWKKEAAAPDDGSSHDTAATEVPTEVPTEAPTAAAPALTLPILDDIDENVIPGISGSSLRAVQVAVRLLDWGVNTGLGADEIGEAAAAWLAAKGDDQALCVEKLELVDYAYQELLTDEADDLLDVAGCADIHRFWGSEPVESIEAIMQAAGLRFGPVSGRQPSAMGWMFKNRSECFSTGAFCNGQVMFVDGEVVASRAIDNDALMRLADYLEQETDDTFLKVYSLGDDFWGNDAYCVTSNPERVRRAMESGGNAWLKGEEAPCRPVVDGAPVFKANIWSARSREELAELRERVAVEVPELSLVFPNNRVRLFDILPDGWDKGCAALELARALGLTPDEVAVFGDSDNDLPMIDAVPNSVAVANANEAVTAAARWHIGAAADDAVAGALHQIAACAATGEMPPFMRQEGAADANFANS